MTIGVDLCVVEGRGYVRRGRPIIRVNGQDSGVPEAVEYGSERQHAVGRGGHMSYGRTSHVSLLEISAGAVEKRHRLAVVRGCSAESRGPLLSVSGRQATPNRERRPGCFT